MALRRKALALVTAALAAGSLAACSSSSSDSAAPNYVLVNGCEPLQSLIPGNTSEVCGSRVIRSIYSGLVDLDAEGNPQNALAENIEQVDDTHYRITLKKGQKFSDGSEVKAHNFVDAWNLTAEKAWFTINFYSVIKGYEKDSTSLPGVKATDDYTIEVELKEPHSDFPLILAHQAYFPLSDSALENPDEAGENPVGTGPYKLADWQHNSELTIVPNEYYEGENKAKNDGIRFKFYPALDGAYADLLSGNLDVLDQIPGSALPSFRSELGDRAISQPAGVFQGIGLLSNQPHFGFDEEGVLRRQALSLAIDRKEIAEKIFYGSRQPAGDFTAPVVVGFDDKIEGHEVLEYNPERAKELWEKANAINPWEGTFTIAYNSDGDHQAWIEASLNSIKNTLGIDTAPNPYPDFKSLRKDVNDRKLVGAYRTGWFGDYPSQSNFLTPLFVTDGMINDFEYSNPDFDRLVAEGDAAKSPEEAAAKYREAQKFLFRDVPAIPTWPGSSNGGHSEAVSNVKFSWNSYPLYYAITKK